MEFSDFELSLLLILVEAKVEELSMVLRNLEFDKRYMDNLEYERLSVINNSVLKAIQFLKDKIEKMLED